MNIPRNYGKNVIRIFLGGINMEDNNLKNIVVLKNLPSNIVEEAIVVLKGNKIKLPENSEINKEIKPKTKEYILKEAECVISNYFSNVENKKEKLKKCNHGIEKKYNRLKLLSICLAIALTAVLVL